MRLEQRGITYPDLRRLWVCFVDDRGHNGEAVETALEGEEEIGVGARRCHCDCAILRRGPR